MWPSVGGGGGRFKQTANLISPKFTMTEITIY